MIKSKRTPVQHFVRESARLGTEISRLQARLHTADQWSMDGRAFKFARQTFAYETLS